MLVGNMEDIVQDALKDAKDKKECMSITNANNRLFN
jgi:hypothetical protein